MKNDLWLDLELREDIDDYATLIYAIENKYNIICLSINNPSIEEIKLFNYTIEKFDLNIPLIISGEITKYSDDKNLHPSLMELIKDYDKVDYEHINVLPINKLDLDNINHPLRYLYESRFVFVGGEIEAFPITVFCGGSLTTLSILLDLFKDKNAIKAVIQGGFASYKIVAEKDLLKKFKKRDKVPTWNLNLDIEATKKVLASNININFVSKNICHDSHVDLNDLGSNKSFFNTVLVNYFKDNKYKSKCLHDLLAFLSFNSDIVEFKKVDLLFTDDEIPKFWSELNDDSNISISVAFSKYKFLDKVKNA